jgi:putative transposase
MSTLMDDDIKRWTVKRKTVLVLDIIQGKTTISEASRAFDLNPSEVEQWVGEGKHGMENALRTKAAPKLQDHFVKPIKAMIEENPSFGYRTVAHLLGFNKNTVQRIFQLKGWQVRKRPVGFRPRILALPSVAKAPDERWATDLCRVWIRRDSWASLALVIDCYSRELLGWHLSRSGRSKTA